MHVPDHVLDTPTSVATGVAAAAVVVAAAMSARRDPRTAGTGRPALVAATTAAVFGLQMFNYPVAAGTSGHLLGGALAAALLGPAWGILSVTVVLVVQSLVFADGGLTALGANVLLMAVVGTLVGWGAQRVAHARLARRPGRSATPISAAVGALVSVPVAAGAFVVLYAAGGTLPVPMGALASQMLGLHALIGLGEAVITGAVVALVAACAPGALALPTPGRPVSWLDALPLAPARSAASRAAAVLVTVAALAVAVLAPFASSSPDGLEAAGERVGFGDAARAHAFSGLPLADYGAASGVAVGVAGAAGLALSLVVAAALARGLAPRALATVG